MSMGIVACAAAKLGFLTYGVDNQKNQEHPILKPIRQQFGVTYADYDASFDRFAKRVDAEGRSRTFLTRTSV